MSRPARIYTACRTLAADYRAPREESRNALARARELWGKYPEVRGTDPLQGAKPDLIGFSWELAEALDLLWAPKATRPQELDLTELSWWLATYDSKELRNLLRIWRDRKAAEYATAQDEDRRGRTYWSDLKRLNVLQFTIEEAYKAAFEMDSGGVSPEEARAQGFAA